MTGLAKTSQVLLSTATVMIGAPSDLHSLNPTEHSIGLVKNVSISSDPQFAELTQGIQNDVVMSIKNATGLRMSMEVYEYTLRNMAYAAGLDGSGTSFAPITTTWTASADPAGLSVKVTTDISSELSAGDYIFIQNGQDDVVHIGKVASAAFTTETTITLAAGFEIPAAAGFTTGARIGKVKRLDVGGQTSQPELGAKIVGLLPKNNEPVTILIPKLRITRGLGMSFSADQYSNMPFEFTPYAGIPSDPHYSEYGAASMVMFPR